MRINGESLTEQFVRLIMAMIMNRELKAGERIPTREIAAANNVSVMPVHLALRELAERKIVVNRSRVGFFVADYSREELLGISQCRRMFETYCLENFFENLDVEKLQALYASIDGNTGERFDILRYQKDDAALHACIVQASGNEFFINQYNQMKDLFSLSLIYDSYDMHNNDLSREDHLRILDCIFRKDRRAAIAELYLHLDRTDQIIRERTDAPSGTPDEAQSNASE